MNPYDEIEYPSQVFPQTHPDRLATIATLRGLDPAPPGRCRMLDLGCGTGLSVISCALASPGSEFVGVDLASVPIARGNEMLAQIGAPNAGNRNVRLLVGDVAAPDPSWGTFDYVVAHGLYSWVPAPVREKLLTTIAACLRPGGVAYVSYITHPGAIAQSMFRDAMLRHTRTATTTEERLRRSVELVRTMSAARRRRDDPWDDWVRHELADRAASPEYLRHDDLSEWRDAVWWEEFVEHAARHGLRPLGEADWPEDSDIGFAPEVRSAIGEIGDPVAREQYRDLLKFRRFRQTLLVHASQTPSRETRIDRIDGLYVAGEVHPPERPVPLDRVETEVFQGPKKSRAATDSRIARSALRILAAAWPRPVPFAELYVTASHRVAEARGGTPPAADERDELRKILSAMHDAGVVVLHSHVPAYPASVGEFPVASPVARLLARQGPRVVSLLQQTIELDDRSRRLVAMLDGTVGRAEILRRLRGAEAPPNDPPAGSPPLTAEIVERALAGLAHRALLLS